MTDIDVLEQEKITFDALVEQLRASTTTKVGRGSAFERLMASYLRTAPEYSDRFDEVYLWQEWPERQNKHDYGIDLVARDIETGGWCAIQCKFYDPNGHVAKADIDSFIAASSTDKFTSRIIISTAKDWSSTVEHQLAQLTVPVVRIGVNDLLESKVDWSKIHYQQPQDVLPTTGKKTPLPHQRAARQAVREGFEQHDRGQMIMACGTGKTFASLKIAEDLATSRKAERTTVLLLVPSIQLLNQTLREWKNESQIPFRAFGVCSDTKVGVQQEDLTSTDLIIPATTNVPDLVQGLKRKTPHDDSLTVVFSTYQSIDIVAQAQKVGGLPDFDLIICDEAHRTTGVTLAGEERSHFVKVHDNDYLRGTKRLYMTATPRLFNPDAKEKALDADAVLASMDDEEVYGPVFHRLGFGEAVEANLLTDYKVVVLTVDESFVASNFQAQLANQAELKLGDAAKIVGCWNGLAKRFSEEQAESEHEAGLDLHPMRRAVAFATNIRASKAASQAFPAIADRLRGGSPSDADESAAPNLAIEARHVDGSMNAMERGALLQWLKDGADEGEICRLLTNARCLSEGVDVPSLDAVLFLTPRGSQVDVVQSVGRVMRRDPANKKKLGYIILPVVIPSGIRPEDALQDNERFKVVWQVLQALRAHDDRFNAMVNKIDLNKRRPDQVIIMDGGGTSDRTTDPMQLPLPFGIDDWRDAIYAKLVQKVGERRYWETWAKDVAKIAQQHTTRIRGLLSDPGSATSKEFEVFLEGLRGILNDGITRDDAIEMLAQHLITRPVFEALFSGYDFAEHNPVARTMELMLANLDEQSLDAENSELEGFYNSVRARVEGIDNAEGRQKIIIELYDKFFATAFKKTVDKLGIVYTPVEIVDFILHSADDVLRKHFGHGLTDEGVHILDGFTGTGTFIVRLLQLGLIEPHDLARKYANELHANEILLLAYYIAAVNIETTYQDVARGSLDDAGAYEPFPGLVLTDTFQSYEDGDTDALSIFPTTSERIARQRGLPITVIVGNPPYSVGQDSANDDNQNEKYPHLDASIDRTYAVRSRARLKISLYDSYIRAIRWASMRIGDRGLIAFVTNGAWLDSNTADGMRLALADEFSDIHVYNLRGNQRTAGERSRKEGGKVFGGGSRATVAITILVKDPTNTGEATIHYSDIGDYLTREDKLAKIADAGSVVRLHEVRHIAPNEHGDWISQRSDDFSTFLALGDKDGGPAVFGLYSGGLKTNRDAWAYNFDANRVAENMARTIQFCNQLVIKYERLGRPEAFFSAPENLASTRISWDAKNKRDVERGRQTAYQPSALRPSTYRPFTRAWVYFHRDWNNSVYRLNDLYPTLEHGNRSFCVTTPQARTPFAVLATSHMPDLGMFMDPSQVYARWRYERTADDGMLTIGHEEETTGGYRKIDNITDGALARFQAAYDSSIEKDDIYFYCYGLLYAPGYRNLYAADLQRSLPRIPFVTDPRPYIDAGRQLSELHLGYENVTPYPLDGLDVPGPGGDAAYDFFRVEKMRFAKSRDSETGKLVADRSSIIYNSRITLSGIPDEAYRYMLGSRSAIEWIIDRYQVKTDKASGIVNDPNDWSREVGDPRYIIDLLARIVTVSLETMAIVDSLPPLVILQAQPKW